MNRVCLIDIPGLIRDLLRHVPAESTFGRWITKQSIADLRPSWPAVTCSMQATLTTGKPPAEHGIVANGIATFRSAADQNLVDVSNFASHRRNVSFWEQSNQFLDVPRFWQDGDGQSKFKTALLFFQNSMPGFAGNLRPAADIVLTPKPDHNPDGKLTSLCWSEPRDLVGKLFKQFGPFPLMNYWGPMANIQSSRWICQAAVYVWEHEQPTLQLTYIPHLDYDLQRFGPASEQAKQAVIDLSAAIEPLMCAIESSGGTAMVVSEYAIHSVSRSIQPNLILREAGLLKLVDREIDFQRSEAFALCDHQIGYLFSGTPRATKLLIDAGVEIVAEGAPTHRRAGDASLQAPQGAWLDYRWWSDPADAPEFASTVDIHRKPGYDPLELFADMKTRRIISDPSIIKGSHGRLHEHEGVAIGIAGGTLEAGDVAARVKQAIERNR